MKLVHNRPNLLWYSVPLFETFIILMVVNAQPPLPKVNAIGAILDNRVTLSRFPESKREMCTAVILYYTSWIIITFYPNIKYI